MRAGVALGSNLGDRLANLRNARKDIAALSGVLPPMRSSAIYETEPVGCEKGAAKFLNAAIEFEYAGEAQDLLRELAAIERLLGRLGHACAKCLAHDRSRSALFWRIGDRDRGVAVAASAHHRARIRPSAARGHPAGPGPSETDRAGERTASPVHWHREQWCVSPRSGRIEADAAGVSRQETAGRADHGVDRL